MPSKKIPYCIDNTNKCVRLTSRSADLTSKQLKKLQKKTKLPLCDGTSFPFIQHCSNNAANWSAPDPKTNQPKQCIITNPATTNLAHGSIYTCGFLW